MLKNILIVLAVAYSHFAGAQLKSYSHLVGQIVNEQNEPITNASVQIGGYGSQKSSSIDGSFRFDRLPNHKNLKLNISILGYEVYQDIIHLSQDSSIQIIMHELIEQLDSLDVQGKPNKQVLAVKSTLSKESVELSKGKLLAEVFAQMPGVTILNSGHSVAKPVINGLHSNRIILLNNGVKQESQQWGMEHAPELDPFTANQFELIKGAQSIRYGADAMAGVLITRSDDIDPNQLKGRADVLMESNTRGGIVNFQLEGGMNLIPKLGWRIQGSGKKLGNSKTSNYYLGNTGSEELNYSATLDYNIDRHHFNSYYSRFTTQLGVFYGSHIGSIEDIEARIKNGEPFEKYDFSYAIDAPSQQVDHQLGKFNYKYSLNNAYQLEAQFSWQKNHRQEFDRRRSTSDETPMSDIVLTSNQLDVILQGKTNSFGIHAGNQINNNTPGTGTTPIIPNFDSYTIGIYGIHDINFEKIKLELGWRYDYKYFDAAGYRYHYTEESGAVPVQYLLTDNRTFHNGSGTVGMLYNFATNWNLKSTLGLAWRAPTANELYSDGVHHSAAIYEIGNLDLKAEKGVKWINSVSKKHDNWGLTVDVYAQLIKDYIYSSPSPDSYKQTIRGTFPVFNYRQYNALFYGADIHFDWKMLTRLNYNFQASIVRAKNISLNNYLPYIPSDRFINSFQWYLDENEKGYVKLSHAYIAKQNRYEPSTDYTAPPAAYHLFNAFITHPIAIGKQHFNVSLAVENILNRSYKDYMDRFRYYAHSQGRNFILSFNYQF